MELKRVRKALVAAVTAVAAVAPQALEDGNVSSLEVLNLAGAALVAGYLVYRTPNAPAISARPRL